MIIDDAHTALKALLEGISIDAPVSIQLTNVWAYLVPPGKTVSEPGATLLSDLTGADWLPNGLVRQSFDINIQVYLVKAATDTGLAAQAASMFLDALITAISAAQRLGGAVDLVRSLRGKNPGQGTFTLFPDVGGGYYGLDLVLPVVLTDSRTRSA